MMTKKFQTAFILSGGGTRNMIYLGMLNALEILNQKPEIIIGTCGGAFAATVYNAFPDHHSRKEYLKSEEYYQFVINIKTTKESHLSKIGLLSLEKILSKEIAPLKEDIFSRFLVEMSQDLKTELPSLALVKFSQEIPTVIVGSEILFSPEESGQKRMHQKLHQKILFTDCKTAEEIDVDQIILDSANFKVSAVTEKIKLRTDFTMLDSARISMSDMFYLKPCFAENTFFGGGAIDLIPIELAQYLADKIIIEKKQSYSKVEEAFVRAVLGYSGNARLKEIQELKPDFQIDTRKIKKELKNHYVDKKIDWKKAEIAFVFPKTYQQFRHDMEAQWNYGYQQTIKCVPNNN